MLIISAVNIAFGVAPWYYVVVAMVWCVAVQFAIDGLIAIIIKLTPDRLYPWDSPRYEVSEREKELYRRLRVRVWKDKVWELGGVGGFSKKSLLKPDSPEYIEKFIVECHKGVLTHRLCYFVGIIIMLTIPNICALTIALPAGIVNLVLNIMPTFVLRYNTPKLKSLLKRLRRNEAKMTTSVCK